MRCPTCGEPMDCRRETYQYTGAGLDNVFLTDAQVCHCACGESMVGLPALPALHQRIGELLVAKPSLLTGPEIRFLRKNLRLNGQELAHWLGVDRATIYRWESGAQTVGKAHDRLLRLIYAAVKRMSTEHVIESFQGIEPRQKPAPPFEIPAGNGMIASQAS